MTYGMFVANERTKKAFNEGYAALNFQGAGITQRYKGNLTFIDFPCATQPVLFYRSAEANYHTAPHYVINKGGGIYRAYVLGQAEVFVFATSVVKSQAQYGIEIYGGNNKLVYQSSDDPVRPVSRVMFSGMDRGETKYWSSGRRRKLAYALHGSAFTFTLDFGSKTVDVWRSVVQSIPGGFGLRLAHVHKGSVRGASGDALREKMYSSTGVSPESNIGMLVVDVHDLDYIGRQTFTFY